MKEYFRPIVLIGGGDDEPLIPPGNLGSMINVGGGDPTEEPTDLTKAQEPETPLDS